MTPKTEINGLTLYPIPKVCEIEAAFGLGEDKYFNRRNLPEVPDEYDDMASSLMFNGGHLPELHRKVDEKKAYMCVSAWLKSFAPAHEAKISTVAYALWLWSHPTALDNAEAE